MKELVCGDWGGILTYLGLNARSGQFIFDFDPFNFKLSVNVLVQTHHFETLKTGPFHGIFESELNLNKRVLEFGQS